MTATDRLDQIEARANAASEGPWRAAVVSRYTDADGQERGKGGIYPGTEPGPPPLFLTMDWLTADAEFIAHARTDVPALVAALRAVQEVLDKRGKQAREALPPSLAALAVPSYQFNVSASDVIRAIEEALS